MITKKLRELRVKPFSSVTVFFRQSIKAQIRLIKYGTMTALYSTSLSLKCYLGKTDLEKVSQKTE